MLHNNKKNSSKLFFLVNLVFPKDIKKLKSKNNFLIKQRIHYIKYLKCKKFKVFTKHLF